LKGFRDEEEKETKEGRKRGRKKPETL